MKKYLYFIITLFSIINTILLSSCSIITPYSTSSGVDMKLSISLDSGCLEAVKEAINDGADLNQTSWSYHTQVSYDDNNPVSMCISRGKEEIACLLIESGAEPNYNKGRHSLLSYAIISRQFELAKALIEHGADVNYSFTEDGKEKTPISLLIEKSSLENSSDNSETALALLENGATISQEVMDGFVFNFGSDALDLPLILETAKFLINKNAYSISGPLREIILGNSDSALSCLNGIDNLESFDDEYKTAAIIYASAFSNTDVIEKLIGSGCNIQSAGYQQANLVSIAARYNTPSVVGFLINKGLKIEEPLSTTAASAEYCSIFNSNRETTEYIASRVKAGKVPLDYFKYACSEGNAEYIYARGELLSNYSDSELSDMLIDAAEGDSPEVFRALKKSGVSDFTNALWFCEYMSEETIRCLVDVGTDINSPDNSSMSALHSAIWGGNLGLVKTLVEAGAEVNPKFNDEGEDEITPLFSAISSGRIEIAEYLLKNGADIEAVNSCGYTPLLYAVDKLSYNIVELLLEYNADATAETPDGMNAYDLAESNFYTVEDEKMIEVLS